jgi:hypothetical protein
MLVLNVDKSTVPARDRLVNGSRGVVVGFESVNESILHLARAASTAADAVGDAVQDDDDASDQLSASKSPLSDLLKAYVKRENACVSNMKFPLVKFLNGTQRLITPHAFAHEVYGGACCTRVQVHNPPVTTLCGIRSITPSRCR